MESYTPPFTVSAKAIGLVAEISALIERYAIRMEKSDGLLLRKANRIKTIRSSLAIEGNELSEGDIRTMLSGKTVIAPKQQILEVQNAIHAYEESADWDAFTVEDLLHAHSCMMQGLCPEAGRFRSGGVGVFAGEKLIHMAPPAHLVPTLIKQLFHWLQHAEDHLLIRSCVFHYEFEFIHPFSDGNGRIGRLWQSLILAKLHPVFPYLPVENMIFNAQEEYYRAIELSSSASNCAPFIDFMLTEILHALQQCTVTPVLGLSDIEQFIIYSMQQRPGISAKDIAEQLDLSPRQIEKHISALKKKGLIERQGARKNGVWKVNIN